ncbi:tRNA-dihydrouridine(47) synthase [NAD(P)(+)] [Trichomonascus vanleenenianus]|uniref:tRNA dihydrouridine synthase DUS3 n=1 Tax=Trichomonascus vanleenenianus TaxID=2268995 RepID=UPI003ECAC1E9
MTSPGSPVEQPPAKKAKVEENASWYLDQPGRVKGIAPIKKEFVIDQERSKVDPNEEFHDEDEGGGVQERGAGALGDVKNRKSKKQQRGQNKNRAFTQPKDTVLFCEKIKLSLDRADCLYGGDCRFEHDVSKYLASKQKDLEGVCPVFEAIGYCPSGIKCRWLHSHLKDCKPVVDEVKKEAAAKSNYECNRVAVATLNQMQRKKYSYPKTDKMVKYFDQVKEENEEKHRENAASYMEPPLRPSEKKRIYLKNAKILSPLTTVGNLPFRRLMKTLGCDVTYCEMALALPVLQGQKSEWALPRSHSSEKGGFAVQIAAAKDWQAMKATEVISDLCPDIDEINLNCGCPIDLLYRSGAGSALMDNPGRMSRILRGMNTVSGDIPVTVKIRTGTRDKHPTAKTLVSRLVKEGNVAAITLHGRSRQQRYTRLADWDYIREVADLVKQQREEIEDGVKPWIIGNGDVYSWKDWYDDIEHSGVDSVMVARGALIKPWIFEEVESRQYLDKSASERLELIKKYAHYGLEHWGSDEYGVNQTRRFLCEWLSFTHRYVPVGILEYLPPKINDRPPPWQGRNELETLLGSSDYKDWIKISEMFLGPVSEGFEFTPKHKSNSYEAPEQPSI